MNFRKYAIILILLCFVSACYNVRKSLSNKGIVLTAQVMSESEQATDQTVIILQHRLDRIDVVADVSKIGAHKIEIKLYEVDVDEVERLKKIVINIGKLEFKKVYNPQNSTMFNTFPTEESGRQSFGGKVPDNLQLLPYAEFSRKDEFDQQKEPQKWVFVEKNPIISNGDLKTTNPSGTSDNNYQIDFTLKPGGAAKLGEWSRTNIGSYLAIVLNDTVESAPVIKGAISDSGQIEGHFTKENAMDLSMVINNGAMPAPLELIEEKSFGK